MAREMLYSQITPKNTDRITRYRIQDVGAKVDKRARNVVGDQTKTHSQYSGSAR